MHVATVTQPVAVGQSEVFLKLLVVSNAAVKVSVRIFSSEY